MKQLFDLQITHSYYRSSVCRGMSFTPSPTTAALLHKWGVLLRQMSDGFVLMCDASMNNEGAAAPAYMPVEKVKMVFMLTTSDMYFSSITDVPLTGKGNILYFSNHSRHEEEQMLMLHESDNAGAAGALKLVPPVFSLSFEEKEKAHEVTVSYNEEVIIRIAASGEEASCIIDLSAHGEGAYKVYVDGALAMNCYSLNNGWGNDKVMGIVEIFIDNDVPEAFRLLNAKHGFNNPHYRIHFKSRATTWAYLVQGNYPAKYDDMLVTSNKGATTFSSPEPVKLLNGKTAIAFYSDRPIPLAERPAEFFQLRKKAGTVLLDALPAPPPGLIKSAGNGQVQSEIFIHL